MGVVDGPKFKVGDKDILFVQNNGSPDLSAADFKAAVLRARSSGSKRRLLGILAFLRPRSRFFRDIARAID